MMWYQSLTAKLEGRQIVNDSKTPSGKVHVGSLRGVLIHDALYRGLLHSANAERIDATYLYGIDDYDPMDGLPADAGEDMRQYMGMPLCHVPAPTGSNASDMADHYAAEFLAIFDELGVDASIYRTRDLYNNGRFNFAIETILKNAALVREVYLQVSGSEKPDDWYPFQVICESCGKIGTTQVSDYSDGLVAYQCQTHLVSWAQGCGHQGRVSPLDGSGKLPWKLEWVAKWATLGITLEGAGKDHCTKGGSHDVAVRCLQRIFHKQPPLNVPYEFFLVSGAKMSSSKGIGVSARAMADFLPPAVLRFLMVRTPPKRTVNFSTDYQYIVKLFNEYDQLLAKKPETSEDVASMQQMIQPAAVPVCWQPVSFQLISALLQLPHQDVMAELLNRYQLDEDQQEDLRQRIAAAKYWLTHYASDQDRVSLQATLPESAQALSNQQKALLFILAHALPEQRLSDDAYQQRIFDCARLVPTDSSTAFTALYCVLLDKTQGPKGGALLAFIDQDFLQKRLTELIPDVEQLLRDTRMDGDDFMHWLAKHCKEPIEKIVIRNIQHVKASLETVQLSITLTNGRRHIVRIINNAAVQKWLQEQVNVVSEQPTILVTDWRHCWQQLTGQDASV